MSFEEFPVSKENQWKECCDQVMMSPLAEYRRVSFLTSSLIRKIILLSSCPFIYNALHNRKKSHCHLLGTEYKQDIRQVLNIRLLSFKNIWHCFILITSDYFQTCDLTYVVYVVIPALEAQTQQFTVWYRQSSTSAVRKLRCF